MKIKVQSEADLHTQVCKYISMQYPTVIFNSDMSGIRLYPGQRQQTAKLRSSRAIPDIVIYEPANGYNGLFIELKRDGAKIYRNDGELVADKHIREQAKMLMNLKCKGYAAYFACGFDEAKQMIDDYLKL